MNGVIKVPDDFRLTGSDGSSRHGDSTIAGALMYFASRQSTIAHDGHPGMPRDSETRDGIYAQEEVNRATGSRSHRLAQVLGGMSDVFTRSPQLSRLRREPRI